MNAPLNRQREIIIMRERLLQLARALVSELERPDWEGCTVRELFIKLADTLGE